MAKQRWEKRERPGVTFSDLSVAVDEIYALRALLAYEATVLEAHLDYRTFPKTRRKFAEAQVERMRRAARGDYEDARPEGRGYPKQALRQADADECLFDDQWAKQRGLTPVED